MISQYDTIMSIQRGIECGCLKNYYIKEIDGKKWLMKDMERDGEIVPIQLTSIEELTDYNRKKMHCDFECVYDDHVGCASVLRCRGCGTIIFYSYSDDGCYEPHLCCPTCSDYKTEYEFWTKDEIEFDYAKQKAIAFYEHCTEMQIESDKRHEKRHKYDWELWNHTWYGKHKGLRVELRIDDIENKNKLKGLEIVFTRLTLDSGTGSWIYIRSECIPLSLSAFYSHCVVPYKKNSPEIIRKYLPWQKRPVKNNE